MRREIDVVIDDEGRDQNKTFHIKEMSAAQAEKWATRALFALARSQVDIGDLAGKGMQGMATMGLEALMRVPYEDVEPLLDELMLCVMIKPGVGGARTLMEDDVEEVATLLKLKWEVFNLHINFLPAVKSSSSTDQPQTSTSPQTLQNTETSAQSSPRFSASARTKRTP